MLLTKLATSSLLTQTPLFQSLAQKAFETCDSDRTGRLGKDELYAGILLVHLQLAKYAGAAACFPPSKRVCDQLFDASDDDRSGYVDKTEFTQILVICCAQILSRIFVYFSLMVWFVPVAAERLVQSWGVLLDYVQWKVHVESYAILKWMDRILTASTIVEKCVGLALAFYVIPAVFNFIDRFSRESAENAMVSNLSGGSSSRTKVAIAAPKKSK